MNSWHIITGEYPPKVGGVGDHTWNLAHGLAGAGAEVHVWTPADGASYGDGNSVAVHPLPDRFGPRALQVLSRGLDGNAQIFVQYVPHAFGWKAMNLPFCLWLLSRRSRSVSVMFHEPAFPIDRNQPLRHNVLGMVNRAMLMIVSRAAERIFVPTPGWEPEMRPFIPRSRRVEWLPVASNVPLVDDSDSMRSIKLRYSGGAPIVGHFGTYDALTTAMLSDALSTLLAERADTVALLLGNGSAAFRDQLLRSHPNLAARVHATGKIAAGDLSRHLRACNLMLQPYPDGASTRRTTLMAALSHGVPVVTTSGRLTESLWHETGAVMLAPWPDARALADMALRVLGDIAQQHRLARSGSALYADRFDIRHMIRSLLRNPAESIPAGAPSPAACESH